MEDLDSPWSDIDLETLHRVTDPEQAAIIVDPVRAAFLSPFLGQECTVTSAARQVGVTPNALLYRVRRMVAASLLQVVREESRSGRAVKVYRSSHDGYLVPMETMGYDDLRHQLRRHGRVLTEQLIEAYATVLERSGTDGARVLARNAKGDVWSSDLTPAVNHHGNPVHFSDMTVLLTRQEAAEVRQILLDATDRALAGNRAGRGEAGRQNYLVAAAILPVPDVHEHGGRGYVPGIRAGRCLS